MSGLVPFNKRRKDLLSNDNSLFNMLDDFFSGSMPMMRSLDADTFKVDVKDMGENYEVTAEMPGIKKENLEINLDDGRLKIRVHHEEESEEENKNYIHRERRVSSMERNIYLQDADDENIKAKLDQGILHISIPKKEDVDTSKKIEIE
ncbi:MAG: Hsp20 family protein [Clostridium sp.]|jgi:HSP20 family protein|nr:Hsp20 family protein [Clostridium sp.]